MKILKAILVALTIPLMVLNIFGAIIAGVWLAILGDWRHLIEGILSLFISSLLLSIALLPSLGLGLPVLWFAKKRILSGVIVFGALANIYVLGLAAVWCTFVLFHFMNTATSSTYFPLLVWSYSVATGPWSYMASKEESMDDEGADSSWTVVFFCELAYLIVIISMLFTQLSFGAVLGIFSGILTLGLIFRTGFLIATFHEESKRENAYGLLSAEDLPPSGALGLTPSRKEDFECDDDSDEYEEEWDEDEDEDEEYSEEDDDYTQEEIQAEIDRLKAEIRVIEAEQAKAQEKYLNTISEIVGDRQAANEIIQETFFAAELEPGSPEYFSQQAHISWKRGKRERALLFFNKALPENREDIWTRDDAITVMNRGNLQLELGNFEESILDLDCAAAIDPNLPTWNSKLLKLLGPEDRENLRQENLDRE